ncbi:hypothetical protein FN846DRAFT_894241 [Sphaerosporella brunnea]|uniref:Uncharacterized protein n=1 Tax=Sphaerosporella brunnea TaxID=1250544 RepID=A0A5J5EJX1_9PEZI|nr:hypothetical protein FN846DRAFT_894241 [Sphaerosporella brunnea]
MVIAAAEGNLPALRIFVERWDWWSSDIAAVPADGGAVVRTARRRAPSSLVHAQRAVPADNAPQSFCPWTCLVALMPWAAASSRCTAAACTLRRFRHSNWCWRSFRVSRRLDLEVSMMRALCSLGVIASQPQDYHPRAQDRNLTLLAPLPNLGRSLPYLVRLIAGSRRLLWPSARGRWHWPRGDDSLAPAPNDVVIAREIVGDDMASIVAGYLKD